ncbi:hypothetical protein DFQ26_001468 [Actinomortierella ambigua]|nr:hypothetical protein DFQ26_001468 [Actinomortierella ambigua]
MHFSKTLILLASATLAFAGDALVSRGLFEGTDTTDPHAGGSDVFEFPENHPAATGSILRGLATEVDYWPYEQPAAKMPLTYRSFVKKVETFPGFFRMPSDEQTFTVRQKDELYNAIEENYPYAESEAVAMAVDEMVPKRNKNPDLKQWELTAVLVNKLDAREGNTEIIVSLIEVQVRLETSHRGRVHFPKQEVTMTVRRFGVIASTLESNADRYAQRFQTVDVENFTEFMTSSADNNEFVFSPRCSGQLRMGRRDPLNEWFL